jgi:hypothetical protein
MINDKELKISDNKLYNDARKLWQDIRAEEAELQNAMEASAKK